MAKNKVVVDPELGQLEIEESVKTTEPARKFDVMALFEPDELIEGHPTVNGLRRVIENFGDVVYSEADLVDRPTDANGYRYTVKYTVVIDMHDGKRKQYSDLADVCPDNAEFPFNKFPSAVAATRAEARCLRKAMKIKKAAFEELSGSKDGGTPAVIASEFGVSADKISDFQVTTLNIIAQRLDINVMKFANKGKETYKNIRDIPHEKAKLMISTLSEIQRNNELPSYYDAIKGYEAVE